MGAVVVESNFGVSNDSNRRDVLSYTTLTGCWQELEGVRQVGHWLRSHANQRVCLAGLNHHTISGSIQSAMKGQSVVP